MNFLSWFLPGVAAFAFGEALIPTNPGGRRIQADYVIEAMASTAISGIALGVLVGAVSPMSPEDGQQAWKGIMAATLARPLYDASLRYSVRGKLFK